MLVFTLAGNHDMYSGGLGYYALIDELNAEPHRQPASYFCLRTADQAWQFLAMDTGYHDNNPVTVTDAVTFLEEDELGWHVDRIREFPGRTILLSHHQLFSAYSPIGPAAQDGKRDATNPRLLEAFNQLTASGRIASWFWGHEHTLSIYKAFAGLERGRCLGHGGVPVSLADDVYKPVEGLVAVPEVIDEKKLGAQGGVYAHGFAIIDLDAESAKVTYLQDMNDKAVEIFSETI
jgi:calcineurin-like phosphoesterase family protein